MKPTFDIENTYIKKTVVGLDEAGCGPWAGPLVAGCVYIDQRYMDEDTTALFNDSKKLSENQRLRAFEKIQLSQNIIYGVGIVSVEEIDDLKLSLAHKLCMKRSYDNMKPKMLDLPDVALVDGIRKPHFDCADIVCVKKGDQLSLSIAAASIVAKVTRDHIMRDLHDDFPHYHWARNAGYGTKAHQEAIHKNGLTPHHRKSFKPIAHYLLAQSE
jgi:ribonuclease HII